MSACPSSVRRRAGHARRTLPRAAWPAAAGSPAITTAGNGMRVQPGRHPGSTAPYQAEQGQQPHRGTEQRAAMLSRIAESLYWLGRHVERADCTARLVDAYLPSAAVRRLADRPPAADPLVSALGTDPVPGSRIRHCCCTRWCSTERALVGFRRADRGAGERTRCQGCPAILDLGGAEHHLAHRAIRSSTTSGPHRVPALGARTLRGGGRTGRRGDEPGRGLELPGRRPVAGTRRHGIRLIATTIPRGAVQPPGAPCCSPSGAGSPTCGPAAGGRPGQRRAVRAAGPPVPPVSASMPDHGGVRAGRPGVRSAGPPGPTRAATRPRPRRVIGRARAGLDYWLGSEPRKIRPHCSAPCIGRSTPRTDASPGRSSSRSRRCAWASWPAAARHDGFSGVHGGVPDSGVAADHRALHAGHLSGAGGQLVQRDPGPAGSTSRASRCCPAGLTSTRSTACSTTATTSGRWWRPSTSTSRTPAVRGRHLHRRDLPPVVKAGALSWSALDTDDADHRRTTPSSWPRRR